MNITADITLFPQEMDALDAALDALASTLRGQGFDVSLQGRRCRVAGDKAAVLGAVEAAFDLAKTQGRAQIAFTLSDAQTAADPDRTTAAYQAIGHVENEFDEPAIPEAIRAVESRVVLDPEMVPGLKGLAQGGKMKVLFFFDRSPGYVLHQHPRGDKSRPQRGVFALCSPHRPAPIGTTVVDILSMEGNVIRVTGLDAINGTPVLDLKPA